ncbi:DUF262 domain-containing protein [Dickeya zeae]|uniref:DUF262 domain-containing protein n=1 Tax=Dickeya zeae TaxID=204042 RepID=UPI0020984BBE|nr:DUF262 domain-containing protein [Dickeya zeae]MCO7262592.1 DUF262 domain-containing protein [Dickeya zeae]
MHNADVENNTIELEDQEELELTSHPHQMGTDTEVRIAKEQSSVFELLRRESRGQLVLAPDFQRKDVWDRKRQSELIESILMGIPIPLIYLFEDENGTRQIIDGKQRISALKCYINNDYALTELTMLPKLRGMKFSEIPLLLQAKLEDCQLHSYVIQPPTPEYVKFNIFERVNRSGINLNKQEMRHALYQGKATYLIQHLAESTAFKTSTGSGVKDDRMRDRYLVLRFVAFYLLISGFLPDIEFRSDIDVFLASTMKFINTKADDKVINKAKNACLRGMKNVSQALGTEAFRFTSKIGAKRRPINMGLFEVLIMVFSQIKLESLPEDFYLHDFVEEYKRDFDEMGIFSGAIDTTEYVKMRFDFAWEMIKRIRNAYTN